MSHPKSWLIKLRDFCCNPYALTIALYGFAFCYLLSLGPNRLFLYLLQALVVIHLLLPRFRRSCAISPYILLVLIALFPIATTLLMPEDMVYRRYFGNVYNFLWVVIGIRFLSVHLQHRLPRQLVVGTTLMLGFLVLAHIIATIPPLPSWLMDEDCLSFALGLQCGLFPNPHYLSLFAVMILPLAAYLTWYFSNTMRLVAAAILLGDAYLVIITGSRPAWLALTMGLSLTILLLLPSPGKWRGLIALAAVGVLTYLAGVGGIDDRIHDFVTNFDSEERLVIWPDTWRMIKDSSMQGGLLGHGIGSFRYYFAEYSSNTIFAQFVFPHNFVLGILFESGIVGLALISSGTLCYLYLLTRGYHDAGSAPVRYLCATLFATSIALLVHTFFTLPFYSKPTLLPLALIVGVALALLTTPSRRLKPRQTHHPIVG